jgi:ABC-type branched-subunit amino acid transport system substrate-binding protein
MRRISSRPGPGGARSRSRRARLAGLAAAVTAGMLLAAGCSSSSSGSSTASSTPASTSSSTAVAQGSTQPTSAAPTDTTAGPASDTGITATTIRVGMIADVDTSLFPGLFQKSVNAVKAWASTVNASGGLDGRQVVVDFCDSKLDPNASANCLIQACQNDFALVGTAANALVDLSDIDGCKDAAGKAVGIPNLAAFAFLPAECDPDTYLSAGTGEYCKTARDKPSTYVVPDGDTLYFTKTYQNLHGIWLYDNDVPTFKLTQLPVFQVESNDGIKKDGQGFYPLSGAAPQSAYTPFIQQVKASGSSFVYDDTSAASVVLLRREAQLQGVSTVKVWECNSSCYEPQFYQQGGAAVNGTYAMLLELPYVSDYTVNPTLDTEIKALGGVSGMDNDAMASFIMALLFQDAVQKIQASGQTLDRQTLFSTLNTDETAFDADGITGPTNIGARTTSTCEVVIQLQNGVWQRVDPVKPGTLDCSPANEATIKMTVS